MVIGLVILRTSCNGNSWSLKEHTSDYLHSDAVAVNSLSEKKHAQSIVYFSVNHVGHVSVHGCMAVWLYGCMAVWLYGCMAVYG